MVRPVLTLLGFQLVGEVLYRTLRLPLPGPVLGMAMLAGWLLWRRRTRPEGDLDLTRITRPLLRNMGLFFVPAGVGIVASADLLRGQWLALTLGLLGSTLLGLLVTGGLMEWLLRRRAGRQQA